MSIVTSNREIRRFESWYAHEHTEGGTIEWVNSFSDTMIPLDDDIEKLWYAWNAGIDYVEDE